jgi:phosphoribosylformylglycinamidine synthase
MTRDELGGSQYYKNKGFTGRNVPRVDPAKGKRLMTALSRAIERGLVRSCHDSSDGGIAVALAEMAFAGGLGMKIYLKNVLSDKALPDDKILFSESNTRFIVEVPKRMKARFESALKGVPCGEIGVVTGERRLAVYGLDARVKISARIDELREVWKGAFKGL